MQWHDEVAWTVLGGSGCFEWTRSGWPGRWRHGDGLRDGVVQAEVAALEADDADREEMLE